MGRVIFFTLLGVVVLIIYSFTVFVAGAKTHERAVKAEGRAGLGGAKLNEQANDILKELVNPSSLDNASFVDARTTEAINKWRATYNKLLEKK